MTVETPLGRTRRLERLVRALMTDVNKLQLEVAELRKNDEPLVLELEEPESDGTDPRNTGEHRILAWPEGGER